jgi:hypothetical protein
VGFLFQLAKLGCHQNIAQNVLRDAERRSQMCPKECFSLIPAERIYNIIFLVIQFPKTPGDPGGISRNKVGYFVNVALLTIGNWDSFANLKLLQVRDINDLTWGQLLESFVPNRLILLVMKDILFCCLVICNFLWVFLWFCVVLVFLFGLAPHNCC